MSKTWAEMTARERDAVVAERVMGQCMYRGPVHQDDMQIEDEGSWCFVPGHGSQPTTSTCPYYTDNYAAARLVEDEIERRGLYETYYVALKLICLNEDTERLRRYGRHMYLVVTATPAQRCEAALRAVEGA